MGLLSRTASLSTKHEPYARLRVYLVLAQRVLGIVVSDFPPIIIVARNIEKPTFYFYEIELLDPLF